MNPLGSYLARPKHPFREMLQALTGRRAPSFIRGYSSKGYSDAEIQELQDWCSVYCKPFWGTGLGLLEAAEQMVAEAVANGNIPPEGEGGERT